MRATSTCNVVILAGKEIRRREDDVLYTNVPFQLVGTVLDHQSLKRVYVNDEARLVETNALAWAVSAMIGVGESPRCIS
jgi:hypothetical protein